MSDTIANILMQIMGQSDDADKTLDTFAGALAAFGKIEETADANVRITGDDKLDELAVKLTAIGHEDVTAKVKVEADTSDLDKARLALSAFAAGSQLKGPSSSGITDDTVSGLEDIGTELDKEGTKSQGFFNRLSDGFNDSSQRGTLVGRSVEGIGNAFDDVKTKVFALQSAFSTVTTATEDVSKGIASVLDTIGGQSGVIGGTTSALAKVFESLGSAGPAAIIPVIGLLGLLITALNGLITTLIAVGASFAAAVAGVVALGAAFVATLGPAVLLAIGVFKELSQIISAVSAQNSKTSTAAKTLTNDIRTQKDAQVALGEAQKNVAVQASAAAQAQRDAVLAVADAYDQVREAQLGIPEAKTALEAADLALSQFKANLGSAGLTIGGLQKLPTDVAVSGLTGSQQGGTGSGTDPKAAQIQFQQLQEARAQALLGVKESQDKLNDSTNAYAKAQQTSDNFTKEGADAYAPYVSALKQVVTAQEAVAKANAAVNSASGKNADGISNLSKAGQKLVPVFTAIYKSLSLFQPAIDAVLNGIGQAVQGVVPLFKQLADPFKDLGKTMGAALAQIGQTLSSPAFVSVFKGFIADAGDLIKVATPGFIALLKIFLDIAQDAMPALISTVKQLSTVFTNVAAKPGEIAKFVNIAVTSFKTWLPLIGAVVKILGQVIELAAPIGDTLVKSLTDWLNKQSAILGTPKGKADFIQWIQNGVANFKDIVKQVATLLDHLGPLLGVLNKIGEFVLKLIGPFKQAGVAGQIFQAIVLTVYETFKSVYDIFNSIVSAVKFSLGGWNDLLKLVEQIVAAIGKIHLPNLTGSVSIPGIGNINPFHHAAGGIATTATPGIFGEAGPEALVPLTTQVYNQLGAAIAPAITLNLKKLKVAGAGPTQNNEFNIRTPGSSAPDANVLMSQIEQRLSAIGAA